MLLRAVGVRLPACQLHSCSTHGAARRFDRLGRRRYGVVRRRHSLPRSSAMPVWAILGGRKAFTRHRRRDVTDIGRSGCLSNLSNRAFPQLILGPPASSARDALPIGWPVGEPGVAGAIGQAFDRRVPAEAKIIGAGGADRPAASQLAQLEQRATVFCLDRLVVGLSVRRPERPIGRPWPNSRPMSLRNIPSRRASRIAASSARQIETRELADDGVAAHPDMVGNFAAG